jgi:shikimate kinase
MDQHPHARRALRQLVARRDPLYARAAVAVETSNLAPTQAVDRLVKLLERSPHNSAPGAIRV